MNEWPWSWEDSACTDYLRPDAPTIEVLQSQFSWSPRHVLVLGCGDGGSMNGMALRNPGVQFTGVDMNSGHINKAQRGAPQNARYLNVSFADMLSSDLDLNFELAPDTVILLGVAGYIDEDSLDDVLRVAAINGADDMRLVFNYPSALTWTERLIYRDAIVPVGRDKRGALKIVQAIAAFHPSETVRAYGRSLLYHDGEQRHMLFAPHFEPMHDWQVHELLDRYDFALIESRTSALALEPTSSDLIRSEFRWQVYGRKQMHNYRS